MTKQTTQTKQKQPSRAARIRALLAEGKTPSAIAATLGVTRQYVYGVRYYANSKSKQRISPKTGLPVRKYTKKEPTQVVHKAVIEALQRENAELKREIAARRVPTQIEIPVPQPVGHFTFVERLRILFFKGL